MKELTFELTNSCIRNCLHCSTRANEGGKQELPIDIIIKYMSVFTPEFANLSGGEPCLRKDLDNIIETILEYTTKVRLYTTCFYEGKHLHDIDEFVLPIFGHDDAINRKIMNNTDYSAISLIKQYQDVGITPSIHIVVTSINVNVIKETVEYLNTIGIKKIKILKLVEQGRCNDNIFLVPSQQELIKLHESIGNNPSVIFGLPFSHKCVAGTEKLVVMSNSQAIPCESYKDGICKCQKVELD